MSDVGFVIIAMAILLGLLLWYVFKIIGISDKFYCDNSFAKVPTIFEVNFKDTLSFETLMFVFLAYMGLFFMANVFINPIPDILANILMIIISLVLLLLSFFEFYKIYICFQLNGSPKSYFFEPEERKLTIRSDSEFSFIKEEIEEVIEYRFGKGSRSYISVIVYCLRNKGKVVFTHILPFYFYLNEYYGELKTSRIFLKKIELNKYFKWFKTLK